MVNCKKKLGRRNSKKNLWQAIDIEENTLPDERKAMTWKESLRAARFHDRKLQFDWSLASW